MPSPDFASVALVTVEENVDAFTVGLAADPSGAGAFLILQCALTTPTDQDAATGMDTYCLMDEQGAVHYGGVERAELTAGTLRLRFDADAAQELGVTDPQRRLSLSVPAADTERLAAGLRRVLTYGAPDRQPELAGI
ncbi:hypothetical protein KGA66_13950 [Actinocrinis puniceicyclus]|uniref:Immunity protein 10 n=1 Tax=Actinocrinis puniceicyclus TaxID=977794 RepID=A0A8J7WQK8_9ACTN|nr:Imm10 family immunity protein [Actinocrinis puniceicyclus]MBS2964157.1 hypothetical protein [Actinocrinis puniceicyclus]